MEKKKQSLKMKLPIRCWMLGHNDCGMIYEQAGNPDKKIKVWKGNYCTRCGTITKHTKYKVEKNSIFDYY